ncbi:MAG: glutamate--tRNA ligase [Dehalococcoidia bacterium]
MTVRVRIAPSPTGEMHIGNIRSSLFDWLFARHHGGVFVMRIEDTDRTRLTPGALEAVLDAHRWLGLDWDEGPDVGGPYGPYFQSERLHLYHAAAERLVAQGDAYRCYCTPERLDALRAEQARRRQQPGYDRRCRALSPQQRAEADAAGLPFVVRFAMPAEGKTSFVDAIRGEITFDNAQYDDHVLLKSDGFPTYHLAALVDDGEMRITHALRGEEWLPSTPRHLLTFRALGYEPPVYAHLPVIVGKDRKKLSKRHGGASVRSYREAGYLPDALFNFLGLIGWSLDDHTVEISREHFVANFDLDRVVRSPALFDLDKLNWLQGQYIQKLSDADFTDAALPWLDRDLPPSAPRPVDRDLVLRMAEALKTRVKRLDEVGPLAAYLFLPEPLAYDRSLLLGRKGAADPAEVHARLRLLRDALATLEPWDRPRLEGAFRLLAEERGVKLGDLLTPLRAAVTGSAVSLPMDVSLDLLGRARTLRRIDDALERLGAD